MVKANEKGGEWERQVCKDLSRWVSGGNRDDLYWRSSMSGGRASIGLKARPAQAGDVSSVDPLGAWLTYKFLIECKNQADVEFANLFLRGIGTAAVWWKKLCEQCYRLHKLPLLIVKWDRRPPFLLTDVPEVFCSGGAGYRSAVFGLEKPAYLFHLADVYESNPEVVRQYCEARVRIRSSSHKPPS